MLTELLIGVIGGSLLTKKYSNMSQEEIQEDLESKANTCINVLGAGASIISNKVLASKKDIEEVKHNTNHDDLVDEMFNKNSNK